MYVISLRKVKNIKKDSKKVHQEFKSLVLDKFLDKITFLDKGRYRTNYSSGMGNVSEMWWFGIFDRNYYNKALGIFDNRQISAAKGFYVVYLFNENKDKLYLSLNRATKDISKHKQKKNLNTLLQENQKFREVLNLDKKNLLNIEGRLSDSNISSARDYEYGNIVAKEYDLMNDILDNEFEFDLKIFLNYYDSLCNYLLSQINFSIEDEVFDIEYQNKIQDTKEIINHQKIRQLDNRLPKKSKADTNRFYVDPKLAKTVLHNKNYFCEIDSNHFTFSAKSGNHYVEAHHLIPMKFQELFPSYNLDRSINITSLCPICHCAIHYGKKSEQIKRLKHLYEKNNDLKYDLLMISDIDSFDKFYSLFYNDDLD